MKRWKIALISGLLALLVGFIGGFAVSRLLPPRSVSTITAHFLSEGAEEGDRSSLLHCALDTLGVLEQQDYDQLADFVHPEEGVTFTPFSTVDLTSNLTFPADTLSNAAESGKTYVWGTAPDSASPISLSLTDYTAEYILDAAYSSASYITIDATRTSGNALENTAAAYPDCHFVEFYVPDSDNSAHWTALKLVYSWYDGNWYLTGIIHSAWSD